MAHHIDLQVAVAFQEFGDLLQSSRRFMAGFNGSHSTDDSLINFHFTTQSLSPGKLYSRVSEFLLAFSCKGRYFCPSCHQKRVVAFA